MRWQDAISGIARILRRAALDVTVKSDWATAFPPRQRCSRFVENRAQQGRDLHPGAIISFIARMPTPAALEGASALALVLGVTIIATLIPVGRAARIDPSRALRFE